LGEAYAGRSLAHYFLHHESQAKLDARKALSLGPMPERYYLQLEAPFQGKEKRQVIQICMAKVRPVLQEYGR